MRIWILYEIQGEIIRQASIDLEISTRVQLGPFERLKSRGNQSSFTFQYNKLELNFVLFKCATD